MTPRMVVGAIDVSNSSSIPPDRLGLLDFLARGSLFASFLTTIKSDAPITAWGVAPIRGGGTDPPLRASTSTWVVQLLIQRVRCEAEAVENLAEEVIDQADVVGQEPGEIALHAVQVG